MNIDTASIRGISRLYHYQRYKIEWLRQLVCDSQMYFSAPNDFNDPWDCKPCFNYPSFDNPSEFERYIQYYVRVTKNTEPNLSYREIERRANWFRDHRAEFETKLNEINLSMGAAINSQYRIYCLSTHSTSELMWAHYTEGHTGVCLEFNARADTISGALSVQYFEDYPLLDLTDDTEMGNLIHLLAKSNAWSYEDEYRLIAQEQTAEGPSFRTLMTRHNLITVEPTALTAIVVGCLMPSENREQIREIVKCSGGAIALKQAVREQNRYSITINDL